MPLVSTAESAVPRPPGTPTGLRLLVATARGRTVGGVETYLESLLPALAGAGHEVGVFCETDLPGEGGILKRCPELPTWSRDGRSAAVVVEELTQWRPDVVFSHGLTDPELERALAERLPTALYAHNYHGTCVSGTKRHGFPNAQPCGRVFGPACLALYLPRRCGGLNPLTMADSYRTQCRRLEAVGSCRTVLVASRHMRAEFLRHGVEDCRVVPLFPTALTPDPQPPAPRDFTGRILVLGRLTALKGVDLLLEAVDEAAKRLGRPLAIDVAGDGPDRPRLERLAKRQATPVRFLGWVGGSDREELLRTADVLAVPSTWPEPFGLVGIEAGCVGLPAVAFALGGVPDWLRPGVNGALASGDPPTVAGLADALAEVLADRTDWQRLREGAWRVSGEFALGRHLADLEKAFTEVLAGGRPHE